MGRGEVHRNQGCISMERGSIHETSRGIVLKEGVIRWKRAYWDRAGMGTSQDDDNIGRRALQAGRGASR